jgi:hypothetical protein
MTICPNEECKQVVPDHQRDCVVCGRDAGYPNVRKARQVGEIQALEKRFQKSVEDCKMRGCDSISDQFRERVTRSAAVLCRPLAKVLALVESDNELYSTFYQLVQAENRIPEKNIYDEYRSAVYSTLFPSYHQHIRFAALTINETGASSYGDCCVLLKEIAIRDRASVFEENSFEFFQKNAISVGKPAPEGYRAAWESRDRLAIAKLAKRINRDTDDANFGDLLISKNDFLEVHIYGPIHRRAIKAVVAKEPKRRADKILLASLKKKLDEIKADVRVQK